MKRLSEKRLSDLFPPHPLADKDTVERLKRGEFVKYVLSFYGPTGIYPMKATPEQVHEAISIMVERFGANVCYDSVDRERVRDIMIEKFGLVFPTK